MKTVRKSDEPVALSDYVSRFPQTASEHTWESFKSGQEGSARNDAVAVQLWKDQGGLCAYCEIRLLRDYMPYDFRVEHFHPKDDDSNGKNYWQLRWQNLLGCCHGGTVDIYDAGKKIRAKLATGEQHCDAPKGSNPVGNLLNPLEIPPFPRLFDYSHERGTAKGVKDRMLLRIIASKSLCDSVSNDCFQRATNTIEALNLKCDYLSDLRNVAIEKLKEKILAKIKSGMTRSQAIESVATDYFPDQADRWPPFFTAIRWYLGSAAEKRLRAINYCG